VVKDSGIDVFILSRRPERDYGIADLVAAQLLPILFHIKSRQDSIISAITVCEYSLTEIVPRSPVLQQWSAFRVQDKSNCWVPDSRFFFGCVSVFSTQDTRMLRNLDFRVVISPAIMMTGRMDEDCH
jgi:hypothetical protein